MSHFSVYVFSKNGTYFDDLLEPYDEDLQVAPYVVCTKEQAIVRARKEIENFKNTTYKEYLSDPIAYASKHSEDDVNYVKNLFPKELDWSDEECYEYYISRFPNDEVDPETGSIYSTYNSNSKWDWYVVGGRWDGGIVKKDGERVNQAFLSEIDWEKTLPPFAFITPNGAWRERGKMGWWGMVSNEKEQDSWENEFKNAVKSIKDDVIVTLVDCHI